MKLDRLIFFILLLNLSYFSLNAQVGIGTTNPNSSAALDVSSNNSGFLPPRLTTTQRDAITNPAPGLMIYNTTENCINFWNNTEWRSLCGGSTSPFVCGDPITFTYKGSNVTYGTLVSANGRCWLDRNLGASQVATSKTDAGAYGDLFQWGRLDDGHQTKTSSVTAVQSATDTPGHNDFIANPNIEDWRNPHNNNLWQGVNGINNPCPDGFRIPTIAEWQTEVLSWSSQNANGAFNSPLKLTMAGERYQYSGEVRSLGTAGNYWSSKTVVDLGSGLNVSEKIYYENTFVNNNASEYRNFGASVRCIKD